MVIKYSKLKSDEQVRRSYLKWIRTKLPLEFLRQQVALIVLVIASLVLLVITRLFTTNIEYDIIHSSSDHLNFGVIVDCGSSGTRAHIYKWKHEQEKVTQIELVRDATNGKPLSRHITPGLSTLSDEPDRASEYMEPIMNFITRSIPSDRHLDTPVHFLATAGMRLLDQSVQTKILSDIIRDLRMKYDFPKLKGQVISGELEGVYSWLTLNMKKVYNETDRSKTYGMIEMGGASTQVTFELTPEVETAILRNLQSKDAIATFKNEQISLKLGNEHSVRLFATTFLGLGVNSARESAIDLLVRSYLNGTGELGSTRLDMSTFEVRLKDPCLTVGSSEIVQRPKELATSLNQSVGFQIKQREETFKVRLEGSGNFLNCLTLLERVLLAVKSERLNCMPSKKSCAMDLLGTNFIPYQHYSFVGLSEMFFTTNEMMNSAGPFNRSVVLHETNRICGSPYEKLLNTYAPTGVTYQDRILYECFKASWLLTILHSSGLRMPNSYQDFTTVEQMDGREIDWTMGAMLSEMVLNKKGPPE